MEFGEKLQELRKQKNLTQQQIAEQLYVSRTAISKWESGRGYPSIDSLKIISEFYSISLDDLLSSEEMLTVAQEDSRKTIHQFRDLIFGLLDCSMIMFLFLPFFGQTVGDVIEHVSLLSLTEKQEYIIIPYFIIVIGLAICGLFILALQNYTASFWLKSKRKLSIVLSVVGVLFFTLSLQPYAAVFTFLFLTIKVSIMRK